MVVGHTVGCYGCGGPLIGLCWLSCWVIGFMWWFLAYLGHWVMMWQLSVVVWLVGLIWNFFWDNEFMVMDCDSWFCWSWIVRDGCYCQLLFLQRREIDKEEERERDED